MDGVRDVRLPVGDGALLGGEALHDAAEPREHGEAAVLELLDLELLVSLGRGLDRLGRLARDLLALARQLCRWISRNSNTGG